MDILPQELIDRICNSLSRDELKKTLTVSRKFQFASERASWEFGRFILTNSNAEKFLNIYNSHRRRYLREVQFQTIAPPLTWKTEWHTEGKFAPCRDTAEDLRAIDEIFTDQINFLFATLKTLEDHHDSSKENTLARFNLTIRTPIRTVSPDTHCIHRKYVCWRVHLLSPERLPEVFSIRSLDFLQDGAGQCFCEEAEHTPAKLDLRVLLDLSVKLPNLEYLGCKLLSDDWTTDKDSAAIRHYTRNWEGPQRDTRHDFATAFQALGYKLPPSLKEAQLDFIDPFKLADYIDQRQSLPNLIKPAVYDPFSSSLRLFSHQLRKLKLHAVVDETLFWSTESSGPFWPNLEILEVKFHMATPKGNWYFQGVKGDGRSSEGFEITATSYPPLGPNESDESWDDRAWDDGMDWESSERLQFRVIPDNELLLPFLTGFARAAAHMSSLRKAALWSPLNFDPRDINQFYRDYDETEFRSEYEVQSASQLAWGIVYAAPGERAFYGSYNNPNHLDVSLSDSHQIWWEVGKWKPEPDLHQLFQKIGRQSTGGDLVEHWTSDIDGQRLTEREFFDTLAVFD